MKSTLLTLAALSTLANAALAQTSEGVIARCGASSGQSYIFKDAGTNPEGGRWVQDGMSGGKIILVRLGDEWDIQFDDALRAYSYRQDGAKVFVVMKSEGLLTVGAFHANYTDLYTFDLINHEVAWTSNKHGPMLPKVSAFFATCE